jgi:hypothetical protein
MVLGVGALVLPVVGCVRGWFTGVLPPPPFTPPPPPPSH